MNAQSTEILINNFHAQMDRIATLTNMVKTMLEDDMRIETLQELYKSLAADSLAHALVQYTRIKKLVNSELAVREAERVCDMAEVFYRLVK